MKEEQPSTKVSATSRRDRRKMERIKNKLYSILHRFYSKMGDAQLTDEQVKSLFHESNCCWHCVCRKNQLNQSAYPLFANEVAAMIETKRKKKEKKEGGGE